MIAYFNEMNDAERAELTGVIQTLFHQTYLLEKKYDRKLGRYQANPPYRVCERHLDFLKEYFAIAGLQLTENRQFGIMALKGGKRQGERIGKLGTLFILILKLLYDEKMNTVSNSIHAFTTLSEVYAKIQMFRLWDNRTIPATEVKRALALLKRYQLAEVFESSEELGEDTRLLIYPTIQEVAGATDLAELLARFSDAGEESEREDAEEIEGAEEIEDTEEIEDAEGIENTEKIEGAEESADKAGTAPYGQCPQADGPDLEITGRSPGTGGPETEHKGSETEWDGGAVKSVEQDGGTAKGKGEEDGTVSGFDTDVPE